MKTRTLLASLTTAAAIVGASAGSASAATSAASESVSQNWAGYVAGGSDSSTQFSNVSGSWVQPTSKCSSGQDDAAFWVGIGGDDGQSSSGFGQSTLGDGSSTSLEQIGTEGNCTGNGTQYYAWYELVPAAPVQVNVTIHPGDHIGQFRMTEQFIKNPALIPLALTQTIFRARPAVNQKTTTKP